MILRSGNAIDAGVAATFVAAVTEISHFGLGGEVPIIIHSADQGDVVVISGQGTAPAAARPEVFEAAGGIPANGPSAGAVPAVVDALCIALAEYGTLSLREVLTPAIQLADGFPWYEALTGYMLSQVEAIRDYPSGAKVYRQGPDGTVPQVGSLFRQPQLARTLRLLVEEEARNTHKGRAVAIYAARDRFYSGDIGRQIAAAVSEAGGLMAAEDLAAYSGRVEPPTSRTLVTPRGEFQIFKTDFWGQGPVLLQALAILEGYDLADLEHNSAQYIHIVTEALKLALADRDRHYGDPDVVDVPRIGLLSKEYAFRRRQLITDAASLIQQPGDPWPFETEATGQENSQRDFARPPLRSRQVDVEASDPDTTSINTADAQGNLFSAAPSSAWFFGGTFIAGDTGVPLGNRLQAFVLGPEEHPNRIHPHKRPRTTLSPTVVLRNGKPFLALSSPGGDTQDQQALQVLLNILVFGMTPQQAVEAPRFNTLHHERSFGNHAIREGVLQIENRIAPEVIEELRRGGRIVEVIGPFMMNTGTSLVGIDPAFGTLFGAADLRRQRFVTGW